jgi:hypothetical protein
MSILTMPRIWLARLLILAVHVLAEHTNAIRLGRALLGLAIAVAPKELNLDDVYEDARERAGRERLLGRRE